LAQAAVILAAGKGTRMGSSLPKVLHQAAGRPLVDWVIDACEDAGIERIVVVVGYGADEVREALAGRPVEFVLQAEQLGTGHAAAMGRQVLDGFEGEVLVLNGDSPLITGAVLSDMVAKHRAAVADASLLYVVPSQPLEYGRLIFGPDGRVLDVVEERDCTPDQKAIRELNAGFYVFNAPAIWQVLESLRNDNRAGEYYVTDVPRQYGARGGRVIGVAAPAEMALGVNTPEQLQRVEATLLGRGAV